MPPIDVTDPGVIKFLNENYEKTAILRMRWIDLHATKLMKAATFVGGEKGYREADVAKTILEAGLAATTRENINAGLNRRKRPQGPNIPTTKDLIKEHTIPSLGLGDPESDPRLGRPDDDLTPDPIMRPVPSKQKEIIYKPLPKYGRRVYLKERHKMNQEDKFYFDECSSWKLGWRLKDSYFGYNNPEFPRQYSLTAGQISRTGPQPDPKHYALSTSIQQRDQC